jgi:hypothetical protein
VTFIQGIDAKEITRNMPMGVFRSAGIHYVVRAIAYLTEIQG